MFSPKRSRWPPIFFTFLTSLTHHLSMIKFSEKKSMLENFRANVLKRLTKGTGDPFNQNVWKFWMDRFGPIQKSFEKSGPLWQVGYHFSPFDQSDRVRPFQLIDSDQKLITYSGLYASVPTHWSTSFPGLFPLKLSISKGKSLGTSLPIGNHRTLLFSIFHVQHGGRHL